MNQLAIKSYYVIIRVYLIPVIVISAKNTHNTAIRLQDINSMDNTTSSHVTSDKYTTISAITPIASITPVARPAPQPVTPAVVAVGGGANNRVKVLQDSVQFSSTVDNVKMSITAIHDDPPSTVILVII